MRVGGVEGREGLGKENDSSRVRVVSWEKEWILMMWQSSNIPCLPTE